VIQWKTYTDGVEELHSKTVMFMSPDRKHDGAFAVYGLRHLVPLISTLVGDSWTSLNVYSDNGPHFAQTYVLSRSLALSLSRALSLSLSLSFFLSFFFSRDFTCPYSCFHFAYVLSSFVLLGTSCMQSLICSFLRLSCLCAMDLTAHTTAKTAAVCVYMRVLVQYTSCV
jgi:hypothetical protein